MSDEKSERWGGAKDIPVVPVTPGFEWGAPGKIRRGETIHHEDGTVEHRYLDEEELNKIKAEALREAAEELTDALDGYCRPPHAAEQAEIAHLARALLLSRAEETASGAQQPGHD